MDPLRTHVRKILRADSATQAATDQRITELESKGHRIVSGGGTSGDTWEVTDWRTGEVIARGDGGLEGMDAATGRLDPDNRWWHIDRVDEDAEPALPSPTDGIPTSLGLALEEWIGSMSTSDEEIAQVAGWTVDEVRACRS